MTYSLLGHLVTAASGSGGATSGAAGSSITGTDLIVLACVSLGTGTGLSVGDSLGNTYTACTSRSGTNGNSGATIIQIFYCHNPSVGSSMTFHATGTNVYSPIAAMWFSGSAASPLDQQNGNTSLASGGGTGSITPGAGNELVIAVAGGGSTSNTCSGGATNLDNTDYVGGTTFGIASAYVIQTTAAAVNPTFTYSTDGAWSREAAIASFKAAPVVSTLQLMGQNLY